MKPENTNKPDKSDDNKRRASRELAPVAPPAPAIAAEPPVVRTRMDLPLEQIVRDDENRTIDEDDPRFEELCDSIRVTRTILSPLHVRAQGDGMHVLIDGERRWRAAGRVGLATVPCEVWPEGTHPRDAIVAGLILTEHVASHGSVDIARRLRQLKLQFAETNDQVASRVGMALARVNQYLALFNASEHLLGFFHDRDLPLSLAVEFMRFERATNEAAAKRLTKRYLAEPFTLRELVAFRGRAEKAEKKKADGDGEREDSPEPRGSRSNLGGRIAAAFKRDAAQARCELEAALAALGYRLVALPTPDASVAPAAASTGS